MCAVKVIHNFLHKTRSNKKDYVLYLKRYVEAIQFLQTKFVGDPGLNALRRLVSAYCKELASDR